MHALIVLHVQFYKKENSKGETGRIMCQTDVSNMLIQLLFVSKGLPQDQQDIEQDKE